MSRDVNIDPTPDDIDFAAGIEAEGELDDQTESTSDSETEQEPDYGHRHRTTEVPDQ